MKRALWKLGWFESLIQDLRFAARTFHKSPGFALTVIGTLALGLGVLATSFSLFSALVLRPFAVRDPYSLYEFYWHGKGFIHSPGSWREFTEMRRQNPVFSELLAVNSRTASMAGPSATVMAVSGNYFSMLGARICMGRPLVESDDTPGLAIAVAGYKAWQRRLGSDPHAVGSKVYLRGRPVEIVGVACPEFMGLDAAPPDFWVSMGLSGTLTSSTEALIDQTTPMFSVVGRLKPGMTPEGARAALLTYGAQMSGGWKDAQGKPPEGVMLMQRATLAELNFGAIKGFSVVFVIFGLILLIACANVSNMMLARGLGRQREIGVRISLGAGRARVVRQLLTEGLLLAIPAALAAYGVTYAAIRAGMWLLVTTLPPEVRSQARLWGVTPDYRVLAFLLLVAGAATLAFGLAPAIQATRPDLVRANRGEFSGDYRPSRLRNALVVAQVTVCSLLLISAAVSLRSERMIAGTETGIDAHGAFAVVSTTAQSRITAARRLASDPAVASVAASLEVPFSGYHSVAPLGAAAKMRVNMVSPGYFAGLGIPLLRGRNFSEEEADAEAPVALLSETAARRLWGSQNPLGRILEMNQPQWVREGTERVPSFRSAMVVGVVRDAIFEWDDNGPVRSCAYFPASPTGRRGVSLLVRVKGDPEAGRRSIEAAVGEPAPGGLGALVSVEQMLRMRLYPFQALLTITGFLGGLALLLTISGIYGVLSYVVSQRRREIGIRMALGADAHAVTRSLLVQTLRLAGIGGALGALMALGVARLIAHNVQPVDVFDFRGYIGGVAIVLAAAIAASWAPTRRAVHINPADSLRCE